MSQLPRRPISSLAVCLFVLGAACSSERADVKTPSAASCQTVGSNELHDLLFDGENVEAVEILKEQPLVVRPSPLKTAAAERVAAVVGVRVCLRPAVGVTAERLELLANCDRAGAQGPAPIEHDYRCPFGTKGSSTTVRSTGMGFEADVIADEPEVAQQLVRRAQALAQGSGGLHGK